LRWHTRASWRSSGRKKKKKKRITAETQRHREIKKKQKEEETEEAFEGDYWIRGLHGLRRNRVFVSV
jgi:hypothetical protein